MRTLRPSSYFLDGRRPAAHTRERASTGVRAGMGPYLRAAVAAMVAAAFAPQGAEACSMYMAKLCRNLVCEDPKFPALDYDRTQRKCICTPHPCWNTRECPEDKPHPTYNFDDRKKINCTCSSHAHCDSAYIAKEMCASHKCDTLEHPILDWDEEKQECICRAHPCWDDDGQRHECTGDQHPLLRYRETRDKFGKVQKKCECGMKMKRLPGIGSAGRVDATRPKDEEL